MSTEIPPLTSSLPAPTDWLNRRDGLVEQATTIEIVDSDDDLSRSSEIQTALGKLSTELGRLRLDLTRPLDAAKKRIMTQEKELVKPAKEAEARLREINGNYATRVAMENERKRLEAENARRKAEQEAAERQRRADEIFGGAVTIERPPEATAPIEPIRKASTFGSGRVAKVWDFEVTEPTKVPREFLQIDESKIRSYLRHCSQMRKDPEIAGVRFSARMDVQGR
jgi:hypothetical protein